MTHFLYHPQNRWILWFVIIACILTITVKNIHVQVPCIVMSVFILFFFRAPDVTFSPKKDAFVCPTFGTVTHVHANTVSIFLNVLDPHAQYAPCDGAIEDIEYIHGSFHPAQLYEKTRDNERCITTFRNERGEEIRVTQIAGFVARRILRFYENGDSLSQGTPYGMIRFGSRVDIELPPTYDIQVKVGDYVCGPKTVLAVKRFSKNTLL